MSHQDDKRLFRIVDAKDGVVTAHIAMHPITFQKMKSEGYIPDQEDLSAFQEVEELQEDTLFDILTKVVGQYLFGTLQMEGYEDRREVSDKLYDEIQKRQ